MSTIVEDNSPARPDLQAIATEELTQALLNRYHEAIFIGSGIVYAHEGDGEGNMRELAQSTIDVNAKMDDKTGMAGKLAVVLRNLLDRLQRADQLRIEQGLRVN